MKLILAMLVLMNIFISGCEGQTTNTIETTVNKDVVIVLESNPTTGYQWQLAAPVDEKVIKFAKSEYISDKTGLVGAGGKETWTFKAIGVGQTKVSFNYVRPWEKDVPPVKTDSFIVIVK